MTTTAFAALMAFALLLPAPEPLRQDSQSQVQSVPAKTCYKTTEKACTSCSETGHLDKECKKDNNGPYSGCIDDEDTCPNGARCDKDQGTGEC